MIGPHYEKLAEIEHRFTAKQMMAKMGSKNDNPLTHVIDKLKRQFSEYETSYSDGIIEQQITSLDRILAFDSKLGPILAALEKQNVLLRKELAVLETQLSNTVGICQQILGENTQLKSIIKNKNEDINKLIETIAINQAESQNELEEKNNLLQQQNAILLRHMQEIKKEHQNYGVTFENKDEQIWSWRKKYEESKKQLAQTINRERDLSRKISVIEHNFYQQSEQLQDLQKSNQTLTFEKNDLKNQLLVVKQKLSGEEAEGSRQRLAQEYQQIVQEHRLLKKERAQFLREAQKLKLQKQQLQQANSQLQTKLNKYSGDYQLISSLLSQQKKQNSGLSSAQTRLEAKITDLKQQNLRLRVEKETNSNYLINRQKLLLKQIDDLRKQAEERSYETQKQLKQAKEKTKAILEVKDGQIRSLNDTINELRRQASR